LDGVAGTLASMTTFALAWIARPFGSFFLGHRGSGTAGHPAHPARALGRRRAERRELDDPGTFTGGSVSAATFTSFTLSGTQACLAIATFNNSL
jgi:hypothetical protein